MKSFFKKFSTPVGELTVIADTTALTDVLWEREMRSIASLSKNMAKGNSHPILLRAESQLEEYFEGQRTEFDLPFAPLGTEFQKRVWKLLCKIPYGRTWSYGQLAQRLGDSKKARAVGAAAGKNPLSILVPCHRLIGSDGSLTGFAGGLSIKRQLLDWELGFSALGASLRRPNPVSPQLRP